MGMSGLKIEYPQHKDNMAHYHTILSNNSGCTYYAAALLMDQHALLLAKIKGEPLFPKRIQKTKMVEEIFKTTSKSSQYRVLKELIWIIGRYLKDGDVISGALARKDKLLEPEFDLMLKTKKIQGITWHTTTQ